MLEATTTRQECLASTRAVRCDDEGRLEVVVSNNEAGKDVIVNLTINQTKIDSKWENFVNIIYLLVLVMFLYRLPEIFMFIDKMHNVMVMK